MIIKNTTLRPSPCKSQPHRSSKHRVLIDIAFALAIICAFSLAQMVVA